MSQADIAATSVTNSLGAHDVAAVASREPWLVDEVDMYRFACSRWFD